MPSSKRITPRRAAVYALIAIYFVLARPSGATAWIGLMIAGLGEALRIWAAGHLVKNKELSRGGPYAHVRNPLYLGTLLIVAGFGVAGSGTSPPGLLVPLL